MHGMQAFSVKKTMQMWLDNNPVSKRRLVKVLGCRNVGETMKAGYKKRALTVWQNYKNLYNLLFGNTLRALVTSYRLPWFL